MEAQLINTYRLAVLDVLHYADGIVELVADAGVTITGEHVRAMFNLVSGLEPKVLGIMTNRKHSYSLSFEAQREIFNYKGAFRAVAILTPSRLT